MKNSILAVSLFVLISTSQAQEEAAPSAEQIPEAPAVTPAYVLEDVVVTSDLSKQAMPLVTAPGSLSQQGRDELKEKSAQSLQGLLNFEPNVEFIGGPRSSAELPQIRGLGADRILILEEGVRQNFQSGHNGRVFADFSLIENLEVVKGPWSALYGSGAMGGVINFRRSTAADYIRRSGQNSGVEIGVDGDSASNGVAGRITAFSKVGLFEPLVSIRQSGNHDVLLGTGDRLSYSATEAQDVYSSLGFQFGDKHQLHLKLNRQRENGDLPLNPVTETELPNQLGDTTNLKEDIVADYLIESGPYEFHAKPFVRKTSVTKVRLSDGREDIQSVTTVGVDTWNNWTQEHSEDLKSVTTLGVEYFRDTNKGERNGAAMATFPNASSEQMGIYLQPTITIAKKWNVIPGVRQDTFKRQDSTGQLDQEKGQHTSGKLYLSYDYGEEQSIFAGWGQAFNAPRLQDLFVQGMHFPGNFFVPNPDLKPETAETVEVGVKHKQTLDSGNQVKGSMTIFQTRAKDFIVQNVGATTTTFANVDKVSLEGVEASAQWQGVEWGFGLSYGQVRSKNETSGDPLADSPADHLAGQIQYAMTEQSLIGTDLKLVAKQDRVPAGTDETPGYFTQDFYFGYSTKKVEVRMRVNNAYNREYRRHGAGIDEVGRDYRIQASYLF